MSFTILGFSYRWNHALFYLFIRGLVCQVWYPLGSSMLRHMSEFTSFLGWNHVPLYVFSMFLFVHSSVGGHWRCFCCEWCCCEQGVQIALQDFAFNSFEYAKLLGHAVVLYLIWGGHHTILYCIHAVLHSHQECMRVTIFSLSLVSLGVFSFLKNSSHPNGCG